MQKSIKREVLKSVQPYFHSSFTYLSELELSTTTEDNLERISISRTSELITDNVEQDLKFFSKKAMKSIWD